MKVLRIRTDDYPHWINSRIDRSLADIPEIKTRSRAEHLISLGLIRVGTVAVKSSYKIKSQTEIEIHLPEENEADSALQPLNLNLDVVYEDDSLAVINKPSGLVVHPAAGHSQDTLVNALIARFPDLRMKFNETRPGIVHRLDKETSGLLVIAKDDLTHEELSRQFKLKTTHRKYLALVMGNISEDLGTIRSFLDRHPVDRKKFSSVRDEKKKIIRNESPSSHGRWAVTHFKCLKKSSFFSYLELTLETGRTHQIRVHLSELGHPIVGDLVYGFRKKISHVNPDSLRNSLGHLKRFYLHAAELGFIHPSKKEWMVFKKTWPEEDQKNIDSWLEPHPDKGL